MAGIEASARAFEALYLCQGMRVVTVWTLSTPHTFLIIGLDSVEIYLIWVGILIDL